MSFRKAFPQLRFTLNSSRLNRPRNRRYASLAITMARYRQEELTTTLR